MLTRAAAAEKRRFLLKAALHDLPVMAAVRAGTVVCLEQQLASVAVEQGDYAPPAATQCVNRPSEAAGEEIHAADHCRAARGGGAVA